MSVNKDILKVSLDKFYTKDTLLKLFKRYFLNFIADGYIGSNLDLFEVSMIGSSTKKETFTNLIFQMYEDQNAFINIFNSLDKGVQKIFEHIAWNGKYYLSEEEKSKLVHKVKVGYRYDEMPIDDYLFFSLHIGKHWDKEDIDYFDLDINIVKTIRKYLDKPADYFLHKSPEPIFDYSQSSEEEVVEKLRVYFNFYSMGEIELSSSNKMLKSSKKAMKKHCSINEYFKDGGDLEFLKTETIALFLLSIDKDLINDEYFRIQNIKKLIQNFLDGSLFSKENFNFSTKFLNYLKGVKNIWNEKEHLDECLATLKKVLDDMPSGTIISVENILNYIVYRDLFTDIISPQNVYDYLYINEADYGRTKITTYDCYYKYITVPLFKSLLTLLGSLGILDLYYDIPTSKNGLYLKNGYLTKYDGLKYVRLNKLGEYVLGRRNEYDFGELGEEAEVYLDEDRLIVTIIGDAPMKNMFLEQIGYRISLNKFKLDYHSFLKNISSSEEIRKRISDFKNKISNNLPEIWQDYFEEIEGNINAIKSAPNMKVFKLREDRELINIVAKDEELRKYILKAEDFYIIVPEEHTKTVLKRLENFGYFNEEM